MVLYMCTARSINGCPAARSHAEQVYSAQRELNLEEMDYLSFSFLLILCLALLGMLTSACNNIRQLQSCTRLQQRYICLQDTYCKCLPTAQSLAGAGPLYLADTAWPAVLESPEVTDCTPALRSLHCIAEVKLLQNFADTGPVCLASVRLSSSAVQGQGTCQQRELTLASS